MRILVASKFYYDRGGAEIVARRCVEAYRAAGHEVALIAMDHPQNRVLPEAAFLAAEVSFDTPISMGLRTLGFGSVRRAMKKALREFRPDVVHFHNIHSYLSPVIVEMAKKAGSRTVWTLHDYKLLCPAYTFPRGEDCTACSQRPWGLLRYRCLHDSMTCSAMGFLEARKWNLDRILKSTDMFVAPSRYLAEMMTRSGIPKERIKVVGNCVGPEFLEVGESYGGDYFLYVGRLSPEKGIPTLLRAAKASGVNLKVTGGGAVLDVMKLSYWGCRNIEFTGALGAREISGLMRGAQAVVIPSEYPENNPLVVMEALCSGTPVVGSAVGGIPELLDSSSGIMFEPGDTAGLTEILRSADFSAFNRRQISKIARDRFSPDSFGQRMNGLIEELVKGK